MAKIGLNTCAVLLLVAFFSEVKGFFGSGDKVRLQDVNTLTLYSGKMTAGRRSSPVKQLQCTGGSAGCSAFTPQVVQCYNRGSDGWDVQWECKSDMDNAYRFGSIEVSCEGYDHPDDEYVLKGSCGLEYTLDLTKEGMNQNEYKKQHSYYGDNSGYHGSSHNYYGSKHSSGGIGDWIMLAIVGVIIYGIYRTCMAESPTNSDYPDDQSGNRWGSNRMGGGGTGGNPPPYSPGNNSGGCSGTAGRSTGSTGAGVGGGGFWTGAAAGGLMGYLFGNRGFGGYNRGYGYNRPRYGYRSGYNSGWGGSGFGGFGGGGGRSFGGGGGGFSSGTRTASGFGGTRRR